MNVQVRHIERTFEEGFDYDTAIFQAYQLLNMPALNILCYCHL
jgi:hypothetical protein